MVESRRVLKSTASVSFSRSMATSFCQDETYQKLLECDCARDCAFTHHRLLAILLQLVGELQLLLELGVVCVQVFIFFFE